MEIRRVKSVDSNLRELIQKLAQEYFKDKKNSPIDQTKVNTDVLSANHIDYKEYVSVGKGALKRFLELFPEVFLLEDRYINNGTQVYCTLNVPSKAKIEIILGKLIVSKGGKCLLAQIPSILKKDYGLYYQEYTGGKQFKHWLEEDFNNRFVSKGDYLYLTSEKTNPNPSPNPSFETESNGEITQMHSVAFMSWWSNNSKTLQKYTKQSRTPDEWSSIVAHNFSYALAGISDFYYYSLNESAKIVFNTGIRTENGNSVYCILQTNPFNVSGGKQRYSFVAFCCIMEEDNEICSELKANVPDLFKTVNQTKDRYEELRNVLEVLIQYQSEIALAIPALKNAIETGKLIEPELYLLLKAYYDKWNYVSETIEYLGWETKNGSAIDIAYLAKRLEFSSRRKDVFNNAVELFVSFAEKISIYCSDNGLDFIVDIIRIDIDIVKKSTADSHNEFKSLMQYYRHLINITNNSGLNELVAESLEIIQDHFGSDLTLRILKLAFYNKSNDDLGIEDKNTPNRVLDLLGSLEKITDIEEKSAEKITIDADELLATVISNPDTVVVAQLFSSVKHFYSSKFEKSLISADFAKCRAILEDDRIAKIYDKTEDGLKSSIDNLENDNYSELTFHEIGLRLLSVIGNYNRVAEKFFIIGLIIDPARCSHALVNLYIQENDTDNFLKVWQKYGKNLNKSSVIIKQLLFAYASNGESELKQFLLNNLGLLYLTEYTSLIYEISEKFHYPEINLLCQSRTKCDSLVTQVNAFERQVFECGDYVDNDIVKGIVYSFLPLFDSLGYSTLEVEQMSSILSSIELEGMKMSAVEVLYELQGNKNGTVETFLWRSLIEKYSLNHCVLLLNLLFDTERYEDVCMLYECYEEFLSKSQDPRNIYLKALINSGNSHFYSFACTEFQECMSLFAQGSAKDEDITQLEFIYRNSNKEKEANFCSELLNVRAYLDDIVLRSIITLSDDLREIAINTDKLITFGFDNNRVDEFVTVYKTDGYSRDRSILGVAHRLYSFIGADKGDITRRVATLAQINGFDASSLLWRIYTDVNDNAEKLKLLLEYPECRVGREREFCTLLLLKEEYETFLSESKELNESSPEFAVQTIIAKCKLNQDITADLQKIENVCGISANWIIDMVASLYEANLMSQMIDFIAMHFDEIISTYSEEEVFAFVTGNDKLQEDALKGMQKIAMTKSKKLALYIFETFGIGRMKGASKEFFTDFLANYGLNDEETKQKLLNQVRIIYSKNDEYLTKIVLSNISSILATASDEKSLQKRIEAAIENTILTADGVLAFMNMANTYNFSITPTVCVQIIRMCKFAGIKKIVLSF